MKVLVCGAEGFIGSHVVRALRTHGHAVLGSVYKRPAGPGEIALDLLSADLPRVLPEDLDVIVNAVGEVSAAAPVRSVYAANLGVTERLVAWARAARVRHFVQLSSVAVYGPLVLGEGRGERTPRLGAVLGLPYMRSKALAERHIEQAGVPFSLLRPPAVIGAGDTVITTRLADAVRRGSVPLPPGGRTLRRVSLATGVGLAEIVQAVVARGPLDGPLHCGHIESTVGGVLDTYARRLGQDVRFRALTVRELAALRTDAGLGWLVASAGYGQHYSVERLARFLPLTALPSLEHAVSEGVSGLQGRTDSLF